MPVSILIDVINIFGKNSLFLYDRKFRLRALSLSTKSDMRNVTRLIIRKYKNLIVRRSDKK